MVGNGNASKTGTQPGINGLISGFAVVVVPIGAVVVLKNADVI